MLLQDCCLLAARARSCTRRASAGSLVVTCLRAQSRHTKAVLTACVCLQGCNMPHLVGLFKLRTRRHPKHGAWADVVLWALFRLQTRLFASHTYSKAAAIALAKQVS